MKTENINDLERFNSYKKELSLKYGDDFKNTNLNDPDFERLYELKNKKNKANLTKKQFLKITTTK